MTTDKVSEKAQAENFHRGENSQELSPADAVALFVENRSKGTIGEVESAVVLANGLTNFKKDAAKLKIFLDGLRAAKVLSEKEAKALTEDKSASRVSKLTKIAEYRDSLLDPRIHTWLSPGYSCLYEFVLLIEEVEKGQQGLDRVVEILSERDGEISRKWLEKRRKQLQGKLGPSEKVKRKSDDKVADIDPYDAPSIQPGVTANTSETADIAKSTVASERPEKTKSSKPAVAALLMTITDEQADRFGKELGDASSAPCIKVSNDIAANAVLLIDARAGTLLSMSTIIGSLGFKKCVQAGLLSETDGSDITSSRTMAVYVRGSIELPAFKDWQRDANPAQLATRLVESVGGRRVHLFAKAETDGWESLISEANWQK